MPCCRYQLSVVDPPEIHCEYAPLFHLQRHGTFLIFTGSNVDIFPWLPYTHLMETRLEAPAPSSERPVKFTLLQKLIFGYSALALLILAALFFSAGGLYSLNITAQDIANKHLPAINSVTDLRNSLIAQEGYAGKYAIFKSSEFRTLFQQSEADFLEKTCCFGEIGQICGSCPPEKPL